jgi:ATP-binding cassette subfamily C protein CydCD
VLSGHFLDVVQGLPTLKVFGRAKAQTDLIRTVSDEHRVATDRTLRTAFLSAFVLELAATLSVAVVAVGIGLRLLDGRLDLRTALVVLILAPEAYLPIRNVGAAFHSSAEGVEAVDAVLVVLEQPLPDRSGHYLPGAGAVRVDAEQVAIDGGTDRAFRLPPTDVHAAAGETVAVLGPTGCGKSSLLEAILGTAEVADGRLTVDGHPVRGLDRTAWHSCVAWLPQRPLLFAGTVADNVRFGEPDATDDEVSAALVAAGAADVLAGLPGGTGSLVGEGGAGLSAGQRQRVAVARVLLRITRRDPRLVLLDEPTAHLDAATEATVLAGLAAACAGRTTILVTHRSAATGIAHRVLQVAPTSTPVEPVPA